MFSLRAIPRVFLALALTTNAYGDEDPSTISTLERELTEGEREHWSFQPIQAPPTPDVEKKGWVRTPIDAFLLSSMEAAGIEPAPLADRQTLLRRVYFDLTGLPPTLEEQERFLADPSESAYEKVVDDLLARPQFGERWARHWLDVVRYAETNGYERDGAKPHAWRYRDYVIKSLNSDKPYDRFLTEQLAGDELEDTDAETQIATTFLRLGTWDDEPADNLVDRYDQLDDVLATTSKTFLAMTMQCARCHSHKFEPISQVDYSRMLAIFEPLRRPQDGRTDLDRLVGVPHELDSYRDKLQHVEATIGDRRQRLEATRQRLRSIVLNENRCQLPPDVLSAFQKPESERSDEEKRLVSDHAATVEKVAEEIASEDERTKMQDWEKEIQVADSSRPPEPPRAYVWYEDSPDAPKTHVFGRGDPNDHLGEVGPGVPAILAHYSPSREHEKPEPRERSTGRRLWLARWLTQPDHPLTARVIVNRIWQQHFGEGIVATESDFGIMGDEPTHPELLDWLARLLIEGGWRMKPIHRMIVLSSAYQMSSCWNETAAEVDVDEKLRWRWKPRRLEAEAIRDASLAISGNLNPSMFGPSVFPEISQAVLQSQSKPGDGWQVSDSRAAARRSIYIFVKRSLLVPELEVMDLPDSNGSCEQRNVSTIAPQALTLMNGKFMQEQASAFAQRLCREATEERERITLAYRLAYARPPSEVELQRVQRFLVEYAEQVQSEQVGAEKAAELDLPADQRALQAFCLALLNSNELVYLN